IKIILKLQEIKYLDISNLMKLMISFLIVREQDY
ncbi:hypothetical protein A5798_002409, partial [Enterococcus sp. 6C8_DIV0013]